MSNTKIVIDKEYWDKIASEFNSNDLPTATEIQIDQSIEEISDKMHIEIARAKGQLLGIINGLNLKNEAEIGLKEVVSKLDLIQRYATSQQIIEQLRVKEKVSELNKCFEKGNQECDGAHCQGCWKDIVRSVIKSLTK